MESAGSTMSYENNYIRIEFLIHMSNNIEFY